MQLEIKRSEILACAAARELKDGDVVFVGIGLPLLASVLAKQTHAPNLTIVIEVGHIDPKPVRMPYTISDGPLVKDCAWLCDMNDTLGVIVRYCDVAFLGGAQIDKYGNLNTTVIGDYFNPKVRLTGSGGANDLASVAKKVFIIMSPPHTKDRFVEKVDYITSPGFLDGPGSREKAGLVGGGPAKVFSELGVFGFDKETKEMVIESYHPGVTIEQIKANTGFDIKISPSVTETKKPTDEQLRLLREVIDPDGLYLK